MDNLNLNIDTYSNRELEKLFTLSDNYVRSDVIKGKKLLLDQLHKHSGLANELKNKIEMFIDTASQKLATIADNTAKDDTLGTWAQKHNPLIEGSGNHLLISNPNSTEGRNAKIVDGRMGGTDETPPGWLNPINIRTLLVGMNVDSRFRPNYYSTNASDFTVQLPNVMRKVTNMRIATVEIPMSFYGISRGRGNATMVVSSATTIPFIITNGTIENLSGTDDLYHPAWDGRVSSGQRLKWNMDTPVIQLDNPTNPEGRNIKITAREAILRGGVENPLSLVDNHLISSQSYGSNGIQTQPPHGPFRDNTVLGKKVASVIELGWLVALPDGNYEMSWQAGNNAADITLGMNNSFTSALPGFLVVSTGTFWCFAENINVKGTTVLSPPINMPLLGCGIRPKYDLCFNVDRSNGKAIIAIPQDANQTPQIPSKTNFLLKPCTSINVSTPATPDPSVPPCPIFPSSNSDLTQILENLYAAPTPTSATTPDGIPNNQEYGVFAKTGFIIHFVTSSGGSIVLDENIQLFLGWQLGWRAGNYKCDIERTCISEGICLPCGPRYMFLSIDDGLKSSGSNFIAAFAESTLDENVMTRINLSNTLDDVGVYKCASDVGLSNQLNRTREYFGPVDISRLRCRLLDEYGRIIDLNNMDWSMSIVFEKMYD